MFIKSIVIVPFLIMLVLGCSRQKNDTILIFAGASMTAPLSKIADMFSSIYNVKIIHDFQGSGSLAQKIIAGNIPDLYIPASGKWSKLLIKKGHIDTCIDFAGNYPVIIAAKNNNGIHSLKDLLNRNTTVAVGDPGAASIGEMTRKIFRSAAVDIKNLNIKARGLTVKQLVRWVEWGSVDAAIVWNTDALESGKLKTIPVNAKYYTKSVIPVCTFRKKPLTGIQKKYLDYLKNTGSRYFKKYGFMVK